MHLNCAYWSSETRESAGATIVSVSAAIKRGRKTSCAHCGKWGATIGCTTHRCKRSFHFGCAAAANAVLLADKRLYCEEHRTTKQATKGAVWDPQTKVMRPMLVQPSKRWSAEFGFPMAPSSWIRCGALTVLSSGCRPATPGAPPVGFVAYRTHWSTVHKGRFCGYRLSVHATPTPLPLPSANPDGGMCLADAAAADGVTEGPITSKPNHEVSAPTHLMCS